MKRQVIPRGQKYLYPNVMNVSLVENWEHGENYLNILVIYQDIGHEVEQTEISVCCLETRLSAYTHAVWKLCRLPIHSHVHIFTALSWLVSYYLLSILRSNYLMPQPGAQTLTHQQESDEVHSVLTKYSYQFRNHIVRQRAKISTQVTLGQVFKKVVLSHLNN